MIPELETLWRVQEVDRALLGVRERLALLPARRAKIESGLTGAKASVAAADERTKAAALAKREAEKQAEVLAEQERKFQTQLTQVKKNEEYSALLHEIEAAKKKRSDLETFVLEKMDQEAAVAAEVQRAKATLAEADRAAGGERAKVDAEENALRSEETTLMTRRDEALATLPANLRNRYERILTARKGKAVAELIRDSCSGCGGTLPPQVAIQIRRGLTVVECPDCGRLIIHPPGAEASV